MVWQLIGMANAGANIYNAYTGKRFADQYVGGNNYPQAPEHPAIRHLRMVGELCQVGLLTQEQADELAEKIRPHLPFEAHPHYGPPQQPAPPPQTDRQPPQPAGQSAAAPDESEQSPRDV